MISVIIPVYNTEKYLDRCIESLLRQTLPDFEAILVDDGSTDRSPTICDRYAAADPRIRVVHKANGGVSAARNDGLKLAKGEFVTFMDADDELPDNALRLLYDCVSDGTDLVMAGYERYDEDGKCSYHVDERFELEITRQEGIRLMYRPLTFRYMGYCWGKLFRLSVIRDKGIRFDEDICFNEDRLFVLTYICRMERKVLFTTKTVYKYHNRKDSAMGKALEVFEPKFCTDLKAYVLMLKELKANGADPFNIYLAKLYTIRSYRQILKMMRNSGCFDKGLRSELKKEMLSGVSLPFYILTHIYKKKRKGCVKKIRL